MIKVGIIGGTGLTGGELIRLLLTHKHIEIAFVTSTKQDGVPVEEVHSDLVGQTSLHFVSAPTSVVDVVFLCVGHGISAQYLKEHPMDKNTSIIDLSTDFRISDGNHSFVYGLTEVYHDAISKATKVANPGCFATAIQLGLAPLASIAALQEEIHIHATTGATGAGKGFMETTQFNWRSNNLSVYKPFEHQHLTEIKQTLAQLQPALPLPEINFIPMRGNFTRGIFCSIYMDTDLTQEQLNDLFQSYYSSPFVVVSKNAIHLKQAVNTNKCFVQVNKIGSKVHITTAIDNLLKGAVGQAVQNMNLMFGLDQEEGLQLKPSFF